MDADNSSKVIDDSNVAESSLDASSNDAHVSRLIFADGENKYYLDEVPSLNSVANLSTQELKGWKESYSGATDEEKFNDFGSSVSRMNMIYSEAVRYGMQAGLFSVSKRFNSAIQKQDDLLEMSFNFAPLMLNDGQVAPPIVLESRDSMYKEGSNSMRFVSESYKIEKQAEVVFNAKTYRAYLKVAEVKPRLPNPEFVPETDEEIAQWVDGVKAGWLRGVTQANNIIKEKIRHLESDFVGMVRYHLMLKKGIVSYPISSFKDYGVNTDGENINIGETKFTVEILPEFNDDSDRWKALPRVGSYLKNTE